MCIVPNVRKTLIFKTQIVPTAYSRLCRLQLKEASAVSRDGDLPLGGLRSVPEGRDCPITQSEMVMICWVKVIPAHLPFQSVLVVQ